MFVFSNISSASQDQTSFISLEPSTPAVPPSSTPQYSPPADENWPPVVDEETGEGSFQNAEDSILTAFRRKNPTKYNALERKMRQPLRENVQEQFATLQKLTKRMADDMQQSCIIINYIEDKFKSSTEPVRKRVKFSTL
jgi:hypothetical protein